jgi:hypothetical protein
MISSQSSSLSPGAASARGTDASGAADYESVENWHRIRIFFTFLDSNLCIAAPLS